MHPQYETPEALRSFLKLCLDPGHGIKRTPVRLAGVMPEPLARKVAEFSPHVGGLRHFAKAVEEQAKAAQKRAEDAHGAYADALAAWIHGEEPKPAPLRSMPLLQAVAVAYDAAVSHAAKCGTCWPGMRFAEMCADGQRAAIAVLDEPFTAEEMAAASADAAALDAEFADEAECVHVAWEVTSEYRNARQMWVKSRKCADCGDRLEPLVEPEPHWPDKALSACPGFEKEYQGESDAKRRLPRCKFCRQPRTAHPEVEAHHNAEQAESCA